MYKEDGRSFWQHLQASSVSNGAISIQIDSYILHKMLDFKYPLRTGNAKCDDVLQEETSIATQVFRNLPWKHKKGGRSFSHYLEAPFCPHQVISARIDFQISCNMPNLGYPLSIGNGMLCCKKRHPLLLKCAIIFLRYIKSMRGGSGSIYKPLLCQTVLFLSKLTLKFYINARFQIPSQNRKCEM